MDIDATGGTGFCSDPSQLSVTADAVDLVIMPHTLERVPNPHHVLREAKRILAAFEREGVEYVLIGSMAMAAQGLIRATRDVDFFVSPEPENVDRLRRALKSTRRPTVATPSTSCPDSETRGASRISSPKCWWSMASRFELPRRLRSTA